MPRKQDTETGKFTEVYTDEDVLDALAELGQAGTREVADHLGCSRRYIYDRLKELEADGLVTSRTIGNSILWERADGPTGINPDDPFWSAEPVSSGGPTDVAANVDTYLYGRAADDKDE